MSMEIQNPGCTSPKDSGGEIGAERWMDWLIVSGSNCVEDEICAG